MALSTGSFLLDLLGVLTAIAVTIYAFFKWSFDYWQRRNIPYLKPSIPFGNFQNPSKRTCSLGDEVVNLYRRAKAEGWKYCGVFNMARPNLMILDLELLKHVLAKDFSHFTDRGTYTNEKDDPLSAHLFSMGGAKWKNLRVKLTPTFTSGKMKQMFQTLVDTGLVLEKYLENNISDSEPVDIKETVALIFDVVNMTEFESENVMKGTSSLQGTSTKNEKIITRKIGNMETKMYTAICRYWNSKTLFFTNIASGNMIESSRNSSIARFSTDIIGSCAFGLDCNSFKDPNSPFRGYSKKLLTPTKSAIFKRAFCLNFPSIGRLLGLTFIPKDVSAFFTNIVKNTIDYREKNNIVRKDFLQLLMEIQNRKEGHQNGFNGQDDGQTAGLTLNEITAQSFLFFLAGFETSSTTMTFALFELATHPLLQEKVRDEIRTVLAKHDNKMTYDSLNELKYMKQVIDETLRMYPPVPVLTRDCGVEYKVPGEDFVIEKGTKVLVPVRAIHYDEQYYKNPKEFDPENFSEENKANRNHFAHIPFGEGPRICIGERFGVMQTKVGLTSILRRFRVKVSEKTKLPLKLSSSAFIPTTEGGMWLSLERL